MMHHVMGWELALPWLLAAMAGGYLVGSIPFGVIVARAFGLGDLRRIGSGNIGATNVLRTGSKAAAALTLVLDMAKGFAPVAVALAQWGDLAAQSAAIGAMLGHCLPVWLWFRGGKGVATFIGIIFALHWPTGLCVCAVWLAAAAVTRISSASALVATAAAPVILWSFGRLEAVLCAAILAAWVWLRHNQNIARLVRGEEPRIGGQS